MSKSFGGVKAFSGGEMYNSAAYGQKRKRFSEIGTNPKTPMSSQAKTYSANYLNSRSGQATPQKDNSFLAEMMLSSSSTANLHGNNQRIMRKPQLSSSSSNHTIGAQLHHYVQ